MKLKPCVSLTNQEHDLLLLGSKLGWCKMCGSLIDSHTTTPTIITPTTYHNIMNGEPE